MRPLRILFETPGLNQSNSINLPECNELKLVFFRGQFGFRFSGNEFLQLPDVALDSESKELEARLERKVDRVVTT
jgi:hypothetical protein